jgi:hypothetical protein
MTTSEAAAAATGPATGPRATRLPATRLVALGGLCGLAWAAGLRGFMALVAGWDHHTTWVGTFGWVLVPGTVTGALLGWAEHLRRTGDRRGRRWLACAPLTFLALFVPGLVDPGSLLDGGIGGGAIALPLMGMAGGYALSGRGPAWARGLAALLPLSAVPNWALTATRVGGSEFALTTPFGAWAALYLWSFIAVLSLGCAIPHRPASIVPAASRRP